MNEKVHIEHPSNSLNQKEPEDSAASKPKEAMVNADCDPVSNAKLPKIKRPEGRAHILTMEEVLKEVQEKEMEKMSLGDGLQVHFEKNGPISFHFRLSENGRDTTRKLGEHPSMSLAQAREANKSFREKVLQERNNRAKASFEKMLVPPTTVLRMTPTTTSRKKVKCFASMKDAGKFLNYLLSDNGINKALKWTIYSLLLIPVSPRVLFFANTADVNWDKNMLVIPRFRRDPRKHTYNQNNSPDITVYLSQQTKHALGFLRDAKYHDDYILDHSWILKNHYSDNLLNKYIQGALPDFNIKPADFKHFFREMAVRYSGFSEGFIDDVIIYGSLPKNLSSNDPRAPRIRALMEWWGNELLLAQQSSAY